MLSSSTRKVYSEVDNFLELLSEKTKNKVPQNIRDSFKRNKDPNYQKIINPNVAIKDQNLMRETLSVIAMLNLNYWCENDEERKRLMTLYRENDKKRSEAMEARLNNLGDIKKEASLPMIENKGIEKEIALDVKPSFWKRFLDSIIHFFKKK